MVWFRVFAPLVGVAVFIVYTSLSLLGFLVLAWLITSPPGLLSLGLAFGAGVLVAAYAGYRLGTLRLVASLQARELPRSRAPNLYRRLDRLAGTMGVGQPPILVADLGAPNALSVGGPRQGAVILDRSLLSVLTIDELEGVIAHELAHIESRDTFLNTLALTAIRSLAGLVFLLLLPVAVFLAGLDRAVAWFTGRPGRRLGLVDLFGQAVLLALVIIFGVFTLAYFAHSRRQEYAADRRAAEVTNRPEALARGLAKIERANDPRRGALSLLYTHDTRPDRPVLLSTHPPMSRRIDRLLAEAQRTRHHHVQQLRPE